MEGENLQQQIIDHPSVDENIVQQTIINSTEDTDQ